MSSVRPRFSDRVGITKVPEMLQIDDMSVPLRASLWNVVHTLFDSPTYEKWDRLARAASVGFTKTPVDDLPHYPIAKKQWMRKRYDHMEWHEVYNFIEYLVDRASEIIRGERGQNAFLIEAFNSVLERESSGYRFVAGVLSPITNKEEMGAVEDAARSTESAALNGANEHLRTAIAGGIRNLVCEAG
ncbi:AbiJ-NTD4 domain-containing protein [Burkholderia anthina]|uniref:AbiJ-NTD4 domain-containing protein n=1 Tax=Burkholderia anthina TaxID=179879 RepID=UPI0037BFB2D1